MSRAVLGLGSNVGDRFSYLNSVLVELGAKLVAASPIYENPAFGPIPQEDFFNAVVIAEDDTAQPADWLSFAARMEQRAGRVRERRWGPRSLDVDVITVRHHGSDVRTADPWLHLPHPSAHERPSVLVPWSRIAPEDELPGYGKVSDVLKGLPSVGVEAMVERVDLRWQI